MIPKKKANTSIYINPELKKQAKVYCANKESTLTSLINFAIDEYLKNHKS